MINKDINFLPERITRARKRKRKAILYGLLGMLYFTALTWALLFPFQAAREYENRLAKVNRQINALEPAEPLYQKKEELLQALKDKQAAVEDIEDRQVKVIDILRQINSILPENCYITYLAIKDKTDFIIEVVTNNPVETARVQVGLRKLGLFKEVKLADTGDVPLVEEPRPVEFKLKFAGAGSERDDKPQRNDAQKFKNRSDAGGEIRDLENSQEELK